MLPNLSRTLTQPPFFQNVSRAVATRDLGDTPSSAKGLGKLKQNKSYNYTDDVGDNDVDYLKFRITDPISFSARLTNNGEASIAVSILDKSGKTVETSSGFLFNNVEAGDSETISATGLTSGLYYIRIQSEEGNNEDYNFRLSTSNSLFEDAIDIGELEPGDRYSDSGSVGEDDIDYYKFNIDSTARIAARLSNDGEEPIAFSILDSSGATVRTRNGRFLFTQVEEGDTKVLFAPTLAAGTYYLRAQSEVGENEDYDFRIARSAVSVTPI